MTKLIMCKGLPASGKSTWAKELVNRGETKLNPAYKRINKDDLRSMLDNGKWSKKNEKYILEVRDVLITDAINSGYHVIVDDTNLHPKHEINLRKLAVDFKGSYGIDVEFEIKDFTDVPIDVCIERDLKRANSVGEQVIRRMYNQFLAPKIIPKEFDPEKHTVVICDVDGTLALFDGNPYDRDFSKDRINEPIRSIVNLQQGLHPVFLFSGRKEKFRDVTEKWLDTNEVFYDALYMRATEDNRPDYVIKEELYREHIEDKYNVLFVLDDRNQVVDLWRRLGLTCLQVADGSF